MRFAFWVVFVTALSATAIERPAVAQELSPEQKAAVDLLYEDVSQVEDRARRVFGQWIINNYDVVHDVLLRSKCAEHANALAYLADPPNQRALEAAKLSRDAARAAVSELSSQLYKKAWNDLEQEPISIANRVAASVNAAFEAYQDGYVAGDSVNWFTYPNAYRERCVRR